MRRTSFVLQSLTPGRTMSVDGQLMTTSTRWLVIALIVAVAVAVAGAIVWDHRSVTPGARIFVANYKDDTVSVIDMALEREVEVLKMPDSPFALTVCAAKPSPLVAVSNSTASRVTFIDATSLEIVGTATVSKGPEFVACSPDGTRLYATSPYDKTISIVDVAARAPAGKPIAFERKPGAIAVAPDGRRLYVLMRDEDGAVLALNAATGAVEATAAVGKFPSDMAVSADGSRIVAASFDDSTVTVVDTASFKVLGTYPLATGTGLLLHPYKPLVYSMVGFEDAVAVLDYETGKEIASFECSKGPTYSAITRDGRYLYVVNEDSDNVVKLDTETGKALLRIAVGEEPADAVIVEPLT
ncbi:MAG: beta-propeller fold lactonase family protein [bacterium]